MFYSGARPTIEMFKLLLLRLTPRNPLVDKTTLVQVTAWCRQAKIITKVNADPDLCRNLASLVHNEELLGGWLILGYILTSLTKLTKQTLRLVHEYVITLHKTDGCIDSSMPYLRQRFGYTVVEFEAWISKYILHNIVVVLINPCLTFKFANECQNSVEDKVQGWFQVCAQPMRDVVTM